MKPPAFWRLPLAFLDRSWRFIGTGFSFAVFGLGGLFLGLVMIPVVLACSKDAISRQVAVRRLVGGGFAAFIGMMRMLGVLDYRIQGAENMRAIHGTLVLANHPTLIDVVFLVSFFRQADCVVKSAVTQNIFMRSSVAAANYISNSAPEDFLAACIERIRRGANLILFPEGTRTDPGRAMEFAAGASAIAVRAEAQILPVVIHCNPPTLRKGEPWYRIPARRPLWTFEILEATPFSALCMKTDDPRQKVRALNTALLELFEQRLVRIS